MGIKSVIDEARDIRRATELIELGARLQVLESETKLSRERLLRLYKELKRKSPPKGMLPFSTDWFTTWQPNIHSSLFMALYEHVNKTSAVDQVDLLIKAYKLYMEQIKQLQLEPILSLTRAWRLIKFVDCGMLTTVPCKRCAGQFVVYTDDLHKNFVCGLCHMPPRAGKTGAGKPESASELH